MRKALSALNSWLSGAVRFALFWLALMLAIIGMTRATSVYHALIVFTASLAGCVLLHELAHAAVAKLLGWRIWLVKLGPLVVRLKPLAIRWKAVSGSFVGAIPNTAQVNTQPRWRAILAAGGLANIVVAMVLFCGLALNRATESSVAAWAGFLCFAVLSLRLGIYNLWPQSVHMNDGRKIIASMTDKNPPMDPAAAGAALFFHLGVSPRVWPDWIGVGLTGVHEDKEVQAAFDQLRIIVATSKGDADEIMLAARALPENEPWRSIGALSEAYALARFGADAKAAQALVDGALDKIESESPDYPALKQLARAAIAAAAPTSGLLEAEIDRLRTASSNRLYFPNPYWKELADDLRMMARS